MRIWMLIIIAVVLGIGLAFNLTILELGASPAGTVKHDLVVAGVANPEITGPQPRIAFDKKEYEFGTMELNEHLSHTFEVRNDGQLPLKLTSGGVSCGRCTEFTIGKEELAPGETGTVEVRWHAINGGPFRQSATVDTNDPARPNVSFTIAGKVLSSNRISPDEIVFTNISVTDSPKADLNVFSYHGPDLKVTKFELTDAETAANFDISTEPMPADVLKTDPDAKSGVVVHVHVKPGLPLGPIRQKIRLWLNLPDKPVIEVPVGGDVTSDIQVVGRSDWDTEHNLLSMGTVSRRDGAKSVVFLLVRGPHRHELSPVVRAVNPSNLKVTIGQPSDAAGGEIVRVPVTIEIPPGSPESTHLGNQQGSVGEVLIDTGHPEAMTVRLLVRFAVAE